MSESCKAAFEMIPGNPAFRRLQWYHFGELQRFEKDMAPWNLHLGSSACLLVEGFFNLQIRSGDALELSSLPVSLGGGVEIFPYNKDAGRASWASS